MNTENNLKKETYVSPVEKWKKLIRSNSRSKLIVLLILDEKITPENSISNCRCKLIVLLTLDEKITPEN